MSTRVKAQVAFYALVAVGLLILVTKAQERALPDGLSSQLGHNSEALCFALLVGLSIEVVRPWARRINREWTVATLGALVLAGAAWGLLQTEWSPTIVTLNEPILGAAFLLIYMTIPRPFRWWPLAFAVVLAGIVVFFDTRFVLDQAESLVPLLIAPLALDAIDRTILEPELPDRPTLRVGWIIALAAVAVTFMIAAPGARESLSSGLDLAIDYGHRAAEAYWGWILVHLYFGFVNSPARRRLDDRVVTVA